MSPSASVVRAEQFADVCRELQRLADETDVEHHWPRRQIALLAAADVLRWVVPAEFDGFDVSSAEQLHGYLMLSESCLTTTFVLTQRNGACQRLAGAENVDLKAELLPRLAAGELFATVGVSHLTTSRQHLSKPAVEVTTDAPEFRFTGEIPWVTGANAADVIVTGGTCGDGRQILVALRTDAAGVRVGTPPRLMALNGSQTGTVALDSVRVPQSDLIAGPVEHVMGQGRGGGTGSLTTSALAIGYAAGLLGRLADEAERRPDLEGSYRQLVDAHQALLVDFVSLAHSESGNCGELTIETVRQRANSLVLRSAQALMAASKGAGYVSGHPAERGVREAMFFLVWSCPQAVLDAQLREFACAVAT